MVQVHSLQRFLHVLNLARAAFNQVVAVAGQGVQRPNLFGRVEGDPQQAIRVQLLKPLAVQDIGLAPRHLLELPPDEILSV